MAAKKPSSNQESVLICVTSVLLTFDGDSNNEHRYAEDEGLTNQGAVHN
jgi:hypothetical protein